MQTQLFSEGLFSKKTPKLLFFLTPPAPECECHLARCPELNTVL